MPKPTVAERCTCRKEWRPDAQNRVHLTITPDVAPVADRLARTIESVSWRGWLGLVVCLSVAGGVALRFALRW